MGVTAGEMLVCKEGQEKRAGTLVPGRGPRPRLQWQESWPHEKYTEEANGQEWLLRGCGEK